MRGGWIWVLLDIVGVAVLGCSCSLGIVKAPKCEVSFSTKAVAIGCAAAAVALLLYLAMDASGRIYDLGPGSRREVLPTTPTEQERTASRHKGELAKEATCRTTVGEKQAAMSHEDCVFIASQIPVMASNTQHEVRTSKTVPSPALTPGADLPSDVKELQPLPSSVTDRLPALKGLQYFLAGQDIVVMGDGAKIAFVVDVRVTPQ